jgi:hypothetical protein
METTQTERSYVAALVTGGTQCMANAKHANRYTLTQDRVQWQIARPPFVHDTGVCFLAITRQENGCTISIGRKGMCADIYTEASVAGIPDDQVDATVRRLWQTGR